MKYLYQTPAVELQNVDLSDILTLVSGTDGTGEDADFDLGQL